MKLISAVAALAVSVAVAQEANDSAVAVQEPAVDSNAVAVEAMVASSEAESAPKAEEPATDSSKVAPPSPEVASEKVTSTPNFDVLRSRAYNIVENQAAAATIADNLGKPHEMHGSKLVYLEPSLEYAAVAFGETNTYFLSFQNTTGSHGLVSAGLATAAFGVEIYAAIGKTWTLRDESNRDYSESNVEAGDEIGAIYSMGLGDLDLTVSADWLTTSYESSTNTDVNSSKNHFENEKDYWDLRVKAAVSNTPRKNKVFAWSAGLSFLRHNLTERTLDEDEETLKASLDSRIEIEPSFNVGLEILKANNARVLLGLNTRIPFAIFDNIENKKNYTRRDHLSVGVITRPNILAELALNDNWLLFGGASYRWNVFATEYLYEADSDINAFAMKSGTVNVDAGVRFQYKNYAVEAAINNAFFNNPLAGFNGNTFIANFGGFIHF